ncbi:putative granule-bound starch synthase 1b, chloroplastic/amyloplastic [Iris pallida]|nr:putative granule-bound starch synthase 1b, chloroplastic/amyloplastic [Iris pallida]KAJ6852726.1 putative granule-bound starch synthase 1b, chloroplastic/amyloplastic [Iris pallida]
MGAFNIDCDAVHPKDEAATVLIIRGAVKIYETPAYSDMVQNFMDLYLSWEGPEELLLSQGVAVGSEVEVGGVGDCST